jgi:hypothetical protein
VGTCLARESGGAECSGEFVLDRGVIVVDLVGHHVPLVRAVRER